MRLSSRIMTAGLSILSLLFLGTLPLAAQQAPAAGSSTKTEAPAAKSTNTAPRRVPNYFGQLGLSREQKDSVYKVVAKDKSRES